MVAQYRISIHAAREGGDALRTSFAVFHIGFQSTPPVKAATNCGNNAVNYLRFQSTPPVKAATIICQQWYTVVAISIHAAREGGDWCVRQNLHRLLYFNPRRP